MNKYEMALFLMDIEPVRDERFEALKIAVGQVVLWYCNDPRFKGDLKKGLMIRGEKGNGKTMICEVLLEVILKGDQKHAKFINARELQMAYANKDTELIDSLKKRFLTIIDDVGVEQSSIKDFGSTIEPFNDLFDSRYRTRLETIITTNETPERLKNLYGERMIDRFKEMFNEIVLDYRSLRK